MKKKEIKRYREERREKGLVFIQFLSSLVKAKLLDLATMDFMTQILIGDDARPPGDHQAECVCALLEAIGPAVEAMPHGRSSMNKMLDTLIQVRRWGGTDMFSHETLEKIDRLLEE